MVALANSPSTEKTTAAGERFPKSHRKHSLMV